MELKAENLVEEFLIIIHKIYGLFLDGNNAFPVYEKFIKDSQKNIKAVTTIDKLDKIDFFYGKGNPNNPKSILFHHAKQGEVKRRNEKNGENTGLLGNFCLIMIFHYWEEKYRELIAKEMVYKNKKDFKIDIFGDIRHYRVAIIHNNGIATQDCEKTAILKFYKKDDKIFLDGKKMEIIFLKIVESLKKLKTKKGDKFLTRNLFTSKRTHSSIFDV